MKPQSFFSSQMLYRKKLDIFFTNPLPKWNRKTFFLHKCFTEKNSKFSSQILYRNEPAKHFFFTNPVPKKTRNFLHKSFTENNPQRHFSSQILYWIGNHSLHFFESTIFRRRLIHPELKLQAEHHPHHLSPAWLSRWPLANSALWTFSWQFVNLWLKTSHTFFSHKFLWEKFQRKCTIMTRGRPPGTRGTPWSRILDVNISFEKKQDFLKIIRYSSLLM